MEITPVKRTPPIRDDCWSESATWTLVTAWGDRFVSLNRGNLRQHDWKSVSDAVNAKHAVDHKSYRTDIQCKNRIDTLKKKYKSEKARGLEIVDFKSEWPFFEKMEELVGCVYSNVKKVEKVEKVEKSESDIPMGIPLLMRRDDYFSQTSGPMGIPLLTCRKPLGVQPVMLMPQKRPAPVDDDSYFSQTSGSMGIPLQPHRKVMGAEPMMMLPQKRAATVVDDSYFTPEREPMGIPFMPNQKPMGAQPAMMSQKQAPRPVVDDSYFRKNYSAVAAAAAAEVDDDDEAENSDSEKEEEEEAEEACDVDGMKRLAKAIESFGETYERVEREKQKQMFELEKQKMLFDKDMEVQRMQFFMDTQVQLEKIKHAKRSGSNGFCN